MEWPEDPRPVGKLESGDGAGSARTTRASPRGVASIGGTWPLSACRGDDALNACGEAEGAAAAANRKEGAEAAARGFDAWSDDDDGDDDERQTDGLIVIERPEVEAALCDAALIEAFSARSLREKGGRSVIDWSAREPRSVEEKNSFRPIFVEKRKSKPGGRKLSFFFFFFFTKAEAQTGRARALALALAGPTRTTTTKRSATGNRPPSKKRTKKTLC